jgi:hypothetical protein
MTAAATAADTPGICHPRAPTAATATTASRATAQTVAPV